jgi:hypothetical protein
VREVLDAAHAEASANDVREDGSLSRDNEVTRPHQHQSGRVHAPLHLRNRDLAQIPPAQRVLEEVVPFLDHQALDAAGAGASVDLSAGVLIRPRPHLLHADLRPGVVARRERGSQPTEDHHAHRVVFLGSTEGVTELDQEASVLSVAGVRSVQHDPRDRALFETLVGHEAITGVV